ncbi:hypothetical protein CS542_06445 [Pedobacter sp. IW39]|nr:hypothetical protein CS542_06445 [Pedobacter sp. IW39]
MIKNYRTQHYKFVFINGFGQQTTLPKLLRGGANDFDGWGINRMLDRSKTLFFSRGSTYVNERA